MELFDFDEVDYTIKLNKPWLRLIPEFNALIQRDTGSVGDKNGRLKVKARRQFAYIYFLVDFRSPIYSWEPEERQKEAMRYTGLTHDDLKSPYLKAAKDLYEVLQHKAAKSLRTLEAVNKGLKALNNYFEGINFEKVDKQGKLLYSPTDYVKNISTLNKAYDELAAFEKRVMAELTKSGGIRGTAEKGDREKKLTIAETNWVEGGQNTAESTNWSDIPAVTPLILAKTVDEIPEDPFLTDFNEDLSDESSEEEETE